MNYKRRKVLQALGRQGARVLHEGGAHTIVGTDAGERTALPRHQELDRAAVRAIIKQLGLDWDQFSREVR